MRLPGTPWEGRGATVSEDVAGRWVFPNVGRCVSGPHARPPAARPDRGRAGVANATNVSFPRRDHGVEVAGPGTTPGTAPSPGRVRPNLRRGRTCESGIDGTPASTSAP